MKTFSKCLLFIKKGTLSIMGKIKRVLQEKTKSVRVKLFLTMTLMLVFIIIFLILANTFMIESYYLYSKKDSLLQAYQSINYYVSHSTLNGSDIELELEKIAINNNFSIVITDQNNISIYASNKDYKKYMTEGEKINKGKVLYHENNTYILEMKDIKNGISFLMLIGTLDNGDGLYVRMPVSSITENVRISNHFLYIIGLITLIISGVIVLIISKRFTKPISEISNIANKMANLDFSQKYRIKDTDDEIDNLGKSINKMSDKLEDTITKLQKNNSDLEKDIEKKSKIDDMRKQFISDVSHELKTPIALIQGYAEGLIENVNTDEENRKFYADVILDEANKMDKMVRDLLDLMKLEYGGRVFHNKFFNILEIINEEIRKYTVMLTENNIPIRFNIKEPIYVYADATFIEQVINNYLSNAIKHVEKVNGKKYIEIKLRLIENNKLRVSVFNTGKNISKENMNKIWTRFYKEDTSRNREMGGTGIGLSTVKAIMENYQNEYGVINKKNGVEFYFDLDLTKNQ